LGKIDKSDSKYGILNAKCKIEIILPSFLEKVLNEVKRMRCKEVNIFYKAKNGG